MKQEMHHRKPMTKMSFFQRIHIHILLLSLLALHFGPACAAETPVVPIKWTPEEAVQFALSNNPDTAITAYRIVAAEAALKEANATFYPRFDLNASYQRTNNPMYSFGNILNQGVFDNSINFNDPGTTDAMTLNAILRYRLYNGGSDRAGVEAAELGRITSQYEMEAIRSHLAFAVVKSFFTIVQAEETLQARQSAVKSINASIDVARARHEAGDLLKADLLNLEVHLSEAQENLIRSQHGFDLAQKAFLNLLGLEQGKVKIAPDCNTEQLIPADFSFDTRAELQGAHAAVAAAKANVRRAQGGYYPTADAFAQYQVDQGYEYSESGNSWSAGLKVNVNLFAGRQTEAQVAAAKARLAEQKEKLRKLSLAINFEVEEAKLSLQQAQQRLQVTQKMVIQAKESASLNRERFKEGLILSSELIDVENRLIDSQVRKTLARAAQRIAVADLRRAIGLGQFNISTKTVNHNQNN